MAAYFIALAAEIPFIHVLSFEETIAKRSMAAISHLL